MSNKKFIGGLIAGAGAMLIIMSFFGAHDSAEEKQNKNNMLIGGSVAMVAGGLLGLGKGKVD